MNFGVVGAEGHFEHAVDEAQARRWVAYQAPEGAVVKPNPARLATKLDNGTVVLL